MRPLYDDGSTAAQEATRDYVLKLDAPGDAPPLLSVFGGKITTYRRLAESALADLLPHLPQTVGKPAGWTGHENLPGGDFPVEGFAELQAASAARYPFLPPSMLRRLLRAYGTRIDDFLGQATALDQLGRNFGAGLTEAELRYLIRFEWARTAADVVWRRSKLGLRLTPAEIAAVDTAIAQIMQEGLLDA